jgi:hypothetical protein
MRALDRRVQEGESFTTPVLLCVLLHTVLFPDPTLWNGSRNNPPDVWRAISTSWRDVSKTLRIPRRDTERVAQILISYRKLVQSLERKRLLPALIRKPYLYEALDFLEIDLEARSEASSPGPTGQEPCFLLEMAKDLRQHAPPPPPPEPRYRFLMEKQEPDFRLFAELAERDFHEGEIEERSGAAPPPDEEASHGLARTGGAPPRDHQGAGSPDQLPRKRRRHRGGRRRRR